MNPHALRNDVQWFQREHPEFGELYGLLQDARDVILDFAFHDWRDRGHGTLDTPIISLEAMPMTHDAGRWRGKFMEVGPLGFRNVISLNMMAFRHAGEIPPTLAHELAHWWDRPNTGHGESFWKIMRDRIGIDTHDMTSMTWVRMEEHFPMEKLRDIPLGKTLEDIGDIINDVLS